MAGKLGTNEESLTAYLERKPALKKRVRLLGFVSDAELCYLYRNARLMVYPSVYEGFGIPVLEAIGNGAPVIVSDIPVFREVTNGAALFVPLGDPEALCEAYSKLESDSALRSKLSKPARFKPENIHGRGVRQLPLRCCVVSTDDGSLPGNAERIR